MKKIRIALSVVLILAVCAAWAVQLAGVGNIGADYNRYVESAEEYMTRSLYQKAAESYKSALQLKEDKEIRDAWIEAGQAAYNDGVMTKGQFADTLSEACDIYPKNAAYWEMLMELYLQNSDYQSAHSAYAKSQRAGAKSEKLTELGITVDYSFSASNKEYKSFFRSPDGYYTLQDEKAWGVMGPDSEWLYECDYQYISPVSDDRAALYVSEKGQRIVDGSGVVQAIVAEPITLSRAVSDGLLPVCDESGSWRYLNCEDSTYGTASYEDASAYRNGIAAVQTSGVWKLIGMDGEQVSGQSFDDILLYGNGDYTCSDRMVASVNGRYNLYNAKGEEVKSLNVRKADVFLNDYIAFQDDSGKWGFMDADGKTVIEPQFAEAKSFSDGLAAVSDGTHWGYIDHQGRLVIDYQFLEADYFTEDGVAFVRSLNDLYYMIKLRF